MMQEVARGQPNGLAAFDNGADDVGCQEGIADCLAHAVCWDGVFGGNLLIGFACFDSVEPGEGVGDIAQECAVDGFRGVAQNELGLDAASTQAERCEDAECILANAIGFHRQASSARIAVEQDGHRAGADIDPPDKTKPGGLPKPYHYYYRNTARLKATHRGELLHRRSMGQEMPLR